MAKPSAIIIFFSSPHPSAIFLVVHEHIQCFNWFIVFPPFELCDVIDVQVDYKLYEGLKLSMSTVRPEKASISSNTYLQGAQKQKNCSALKRRLPVRSRYVLDRQNPSNRKSEQPSSLLSSFASCINTVENLHT